MPLPLPFSTLAALCCSWGAAPVVRGAPSQEAQVRPTVTDAVATVQRRSGELVRRPLSELAPAAFRELDGVAFELEARSAPPSSFASPAELAVVRLAPSDVVVARIASARGEAMQLELSPGSRLDVTIDDVLSIAFEARMSEQGVPTAPQSGDRLYWLRPKGVDRVDGAFQEFTEEGVVFDSALGVRTFAWSEVGALFVEPLGAPEEPKRDPSSVSVDLVGGGRLHGRWTGLQDGALQLEWRRAARLELPEKLIAQVVLDDGTVTHLSARAPSVAREGWPADDDSGMRWPYQLDRSVMGGPLRAGGRTWPRGVGVHAPSRLEWELDGSWRALHGAVAIDSSVSLLAYQGSVRCAIYLDGAVEPAWRSARIVGGAAPTSIPVLDLKGVKRIGLEVDMDERLYVADRLDWIGMRLVR